MGRHRRTGTQLPPILRHATRAQLVLLVVALAANACLLVPLVAMWLTASSHNRALDTYTVADCLQPDDGSVTGSVRYLIADQVAATFERPWVLRLEPKAPDQPTLLCRYAIPGGDGDLPYAVAVWELEQ